MVGWGANRFGEEYLEDRKARRREVLEGSSACCVVQREIRVWKRESGGEKRS